MPRLLPADVARLGAIAQQRVADVTALLGQPDDRALGADAEHAVKSFGAALARLVRARIRIRPATRPGLAVSAWLREQRVTLADDGVGFVVLAPEQRGPKAQRATRRPLQRLHDLTLGGERLSVVLARAALAQLALPDPELHAEYRIVRIPEIAAIHGIAEDELLERWRRKEVRRAFGWPIHYGNGDWGLPLPVLADQAQLLARQSSLVEPPHPVPLPEGFET